MPVRGMDIGEWDRGGEVVHESSSVVDHQELKLFGFAFADQRKSADTMMLTRCLGYFAGGLLGNGAGRLGRQIDRGRFHGHLFK